MYELYNPKFRFREKDIAFIHAHLDEGDSILLSGIRRTGKSELILAALYHYQKKGRAVAFLDVQHESDLAVFYDRLLKVLMGVTPSDFRLQLFNALDQVVQIPQKLMTALRNNIKSVDAPAEMGGIEFQPLDPDQLRNYWKELVDQIAKLLASHEYQNLPVIAIDELPFMLENLINKNVPDQDLREMLASLRTLRGAGLRMVIGGSISFENFLSINNIPHTVLGGMFRHHIRPFGREEASQFLVEKFGSVYAASPESMTLILDTLPDYVPEILKIAYGYLLHCQNIDSCRHALTNEVMPAVRRVFVQQFQDRLVKNYSSEERLCAEKVLDRLAQGDEGGVVLKIRQFPSNYLQVISKLQYDNFVEDSPNGGLKFSLNSLRNWWCSNRGEN